MRVSNLLIILLTISNISIIYGIDQEKDPYSKSID